MKFSTGFVIAILCSFFAIATSVTLENYGIPYDLDMHCNDCSSGNVIPLGYDIVYFGETYNKMYVSSNGMISLGMAGPDQLTFDTMAIIAPWMIHLDTEPLSNSVLDGTVFYRTVIGDDTSFDNFVLDNFGVSFHTAYEVVVTYDLVKYYGQMDAARDTIQAVIYSSAYGQTVVCFNYPADGLNWPDSSSTAYPIVGFYSGPDLNLAYYLPGSGTPAAANLDNIVGDFGVVGQFCYLVSGLEVVDSCLIQNLVCNPPSFFPINTPITASDILSSYSMCNDQTLDITATSFNCSQVGEIIPVTASIDSISCTTFFIPAVITAIGFENCPSNVLVVSSVPTTAYWTPPVAFGSCLNSGQETVNYVPGVSVFQVGVTTVTYIAFDTLLNSVSCSFDVIVQAPVMITFNVIDNLNRPIIGAGISGSTLSCPFTNSNGLCSISAPNLSVGEVIPAGDWYIIFNATIFAIPHAAITINCLDTSIVIVLSPPGFYRGNSGDIIACSAGTYSTVYEATGCESCPIGTYTDYDFATFCDLCPLGYSSGVGAVSCFACSAGYYLDIPSGDCLLCPAGTYSCDRAIECTVCPLGAYSYAGSPDCFYCEAGFYLDIFSSSCVPCPANTFSGDRAITCTPCTFGSYSSQGSTNCSFCVAGFYLDINTYSCLPCPGGTFSCDRATECTICPDGSYASPGSAECQFCTAGYYMAMNESQVMCGCSPCPAGTFSCDRSGDCEPCPPGSYSAPGSSECFFCYAGYYLDINVGACVICPPDTFSNDRALMCSPCPYGSYSFAGSTECIFCDAGYYYNLATLVCDLCPAGTFSTDRAIECILCPPGSYSFTGSTECIFCTAGYYLDNFTDSCLPCPSNTYSCDRAISCSPCPDGSYSFAGSSICIFCDAGYYYDNGTGNCVPCSAGFFSSNRATFCTPCPPGFYSLPGSSICYSCTAGFYLDTNTGACIACPAGTTSGDRALFCTIIPVITQNEQIFCTAGFYFNAATNSCIPCPANTYSNDRAVVCTACPTGSYSTLGSSVCIFCSAGYYLDPILGCIPCPTNYFSPDRATVCLPCPAGYVSGVASGYCTPCPNGTVVNNITGNCEPCPAGSFIFGYICLSCAYAIPEVCNICPPGSEPDLVCTECCAGYYSDGCGPCLPCPPGTYSGAGASTCVYCESGFVWDDISCGCIVVPS